MEEYSGGLLSEHRFPEMDKMPVIVAEPTRSCDCECVHWARRWSGDGIKTMHHPKCDQSKLESGDATEYWKGALGVASNPPTNPLAKTINKYGEPSPMVSER